MASWAAPSKDRNSQGSLNGLSMAARIEGQAQGPRCVLTAVKVI